VQETHSSRSVDGRSAPAFALPYYYFINLFSTQYSAQYFAGCSNGFLSLLNINFSKYNKKF
jgi:hypothetical protein